MAELTSIERVTRQFNGQSVDRIATQEEFWPELIKIWREQGVLGPDEHPDYHFDLDMTKKWLFNYKLDPRFADKVIAEDEDTFTVVDGNGATLRRYKTHASTPEHVDFSVKSREDWEEKAKPLLKSFDLHERFNAQMYREYKERAAKHNKFFIGLAVQVFECMHPICGHEDLLMGMALDPDWVKDMAATYAELNINLLEMLFSENGKPDAMWFFEDMGFKERPFMSPAMYRELILPAHKKVFDFVHANNLKVIMHSCGFVEPLIPGIIEAGVDCLEAMEVKAGMDLLRIHRNYGNKLCLMGGLDVRPVGDNDFAGMRQEVASKLPVVMKDYKYFFQSDHSIPESTDYESYKYFLSLAREFGSYKNF